MLKNKSLVFLLVVGFCIPALKAHAQAQTESPYLDNTTSLNGSTGLWNVVTPDTLQPKEASFSAWVNRINRNPGQLTITTWGFGGSVGLTNWLEFGLDLEANTRVLVRRSDELSIGQQQLGLFGAQFPGAAPFPSQLMPGSTLLPQLRFPATPAGALTGATGYYNDLPFAGMLNSSNGIGTADVSLKFSILSRKRGNRFDVGVRTYADIPTHRSESFLLFRPSQSGGLILGSDLLLGAGISRTDIYLNAGFRGMQSNSGGNPVEIANVVPLSIGLTFPRQSRLQLMSEMTSEILVGDHTPNTSVDAEDPLDWTLGFRTFVNRYINFSAGYRRPLNQYGGDKNGFVFELGYTYGPPAVVTPPSPPSASCSVNPTQVQPGQMIQLSVQSTPTMTGSTLGYAWTTTGGTLQSADSASAQLSTDGLAAGSYTATVRVTEKPAAAPKHGAEPLYADCTTRFTVVIPPPPARPPTVSITSDRNSVQVGEAVTFTAHGESPDNRPLTYQWNTTGGSLQGSGTTARLDTAGARPGSITVTARAADDRNLSAQGSKSITVTAPPPPPPAPQEQLLDQCQFKLNSARVDNVCKAKLDNVALRLQSESDSTLTIVGFAASNERRAQQLSQTRADNVRAYLSKDKGIAEGRLTSRTGAAGTGEQARRAEMHLVPRGATFTGYNLKRQQEKKTVGRAAPPMHAARQPAGRIIATLR